MNKIYIVQVAYGEYTIRNIVAFFDKVLAHQWAKDAQAVADKQQRQKIRLFKWARCSRDGSIQKNLFMAYHPTNPYDKEYRIDTWYRHTYLVDEVDGPYIILQCREG